MEKHSKTSLFKVTAPVTLSLGILLASGIGPWEPATHTEAAAITYYQTTSNLNMRQTASSKGKILITIPKGKTVSYISKSGTWYKVKYGTKTGYVSSSYLKKTSTTTSAAAKTYTYQTTDNLNLRATASANAKILLSIPKGKNVTYISTSGSWYKVKYNDKTGYVSSKYIKKTLVTASKPVEVPPVNFTATNYQTTASLNMRETASASGKLIMTIPKGEVVVAASKTNENWYKVKYGTKSGWVSGSYLQEYYKYTNTTSIYYSIKKTANLYPMPDTKKAKSYTVPVNNVLASTQTVVNSKGETWYRIAYLGKNYYVISGEVSKVTPVTEKPKTYVAKGATSLYTATGSAQGTLVAIPKGSKITSSYRIEKWNKATFNGKTGYVDSSMFSLYVEPPVTSGPADTNTKPEDVQISRPAGQVISERMYTTIADELNYRVSDNASAELLGKIPFKTQLKTSYKTNKGWYEVTYNGKTGYASSDYLIDETNATRLDTMENNRNSYIFMDLRTKSSVTASQIDAYIAKSATESNSALYGKGQAIINAANKYGVNALYLAAHAIHESGYGTSTISKGKNNLFGFGSYDITPYIGSVKFQSIESNIEFIAQEMKATYLNPSMWKYNGAYLGYTIKNINGVRVDELSKGMNFYYATDSNWGNAIAKHMNGILDYSKEEAKNQTPNTKVPERPVYPDGKDIFPNKTLAVAKASINLRKLKDSKEPIAATIKSGESFNILSKWNDYWLTINYKGITYYTNNYSLSEYTKYFSVKNLARVDADALNVRPEPNTNKASISTFYKYQFIELSLDANKNAITSNGWNKVLLSDGKVGWVSGQYLKRELQ